MIIIFTSAILFVNLYDYYRSIDANLDTDTLFYSHGLTTKIYVKNKVGAAVELESQRLYGLENRIFADIDTIPEHVKNAFIAIEDHRFYEHNGVDIYRTGGAVLSFISPSAQGYGGSTITQQLVKNLTGDSEVTVKRKLTEIKRATELEKKKSKSEILEMYLNTVYLSQGCYGIETAAENISKKSFRTNHSRRRVSRRDNSVSHPLRPYCKSGKQQPQKEYYSCPYERTRSSFG